MLHHPLVALLATVRGITGIAGRLAFPIVGRRIGTVGAVVLATTVGILTLATTPYLTAIPVLALIGFLGEGVEALKDPGTIVGVACATTVSDRALGFTNINQVSAMAALAGSVALGSIAENVLGPAAALGYVLLFTVLKRLAAETATAGRRRAT